MEVDIEIFDMKIGRLLMGFRQVANFLVEKKNYVYVGMYLECEIGWEEDIYQHFLVFTYCKITL